MIESQSRTFCQCDGCHESQTGKLASKKKQSVRPPQNTMRAAASTSSAYYNSRNRNNNNYYSSTNYYTNANRGGPDVDAALQDASVAYYQGLRKTLRSRAAAAQSASRSGAGSTMRDQTLRKFQPDEALESYQVVGASVPLRRRDRLQELLLLERKHRLLAQQRAMEEGITITDPVLEGELRNEIYGNDAFFQEKGTGTDPEGRFLHSSEPLTTRSEELQAQRTAAENGEGSDSGSNDDRHCTARAELKQCVEDMESARQQNPNSIATARKLRKAVQEHKDKWNAELNDCDVPHQCNHCFETDCKWDYVPADCTGVPLDNPDDTFATRGETWKIGRTTGSAGAGTTRSQHPLLASQSNAFSRTAPQSTRGKKATSLYTADGHLKGYTPHPFGTGVVWMPLNTPTPTPTPSESTTPTAATALRSGFPATQGRSMPTYTQNNQNAPLQSTQLSPLDVVQHPGGVYGGYLGASQVQAGTGNAGKKVNFDTPQSASQSLTPSRGSTQSQGHTYNATNNILGSSGMSNYSAPEVNAQPSGERAKTADRSTGANRSDTLPTIASSTPASSAALWMSTNQQRDQDMRRFMDFMKQSVYSSSSISGRRA